MEPEIVVVNLETFEEKRYFGSPEEAVMAAHAQSLRDYEYYCYYERYYGKVEQNSSFVKCGQWIAFTMEPKTH